MGVPCLPLYMDEITIFMQVALVWVYKVRIIVIILVRVYSIINLLVDQLFLLLFWYRLKLFFDTC